MPSAMVTRSLSQPSQQVEHEFQRAGNVDCQRCRVNLDYYIRTGEVPFGPSHDGSRACRNRTALAAGGTQVHCTCAGCF